MPDQSPNQLPNYPITQLPNSRSAVVVILNASSGLDPRAPADIGALFLAAGCHAEIVTLASGQNPLDAARRASARASIVVAAGGDGTVSGVAAGVFGTPAILGVLPLGTLNHFAKDLGLPLDPEKAVAAIVAGRVGRIDVGQVNDRLFVNNSSIGLYPNIIDARDALRREGHSKWPAMARATVRVLRHYRGVLVKIEWDGRTQVWRTPFVFVGNNEYTLEGRHPGVRTRLDGGRLFAYVTPRVHTRELPMLVAKALLGRARQSGAFEIVPATELVIATPKARYVRIACDGEPTTMKTPLRYRVHPGGLKVILP